MPLSTMARVGLMQKIESLLQQLDGDYDLKDLRNAISDLIVNHIQALKDSLGYWEKTHFANAIAAFALNMNSLHQPTTAWLRLCLVDLEKVLVPESQRNESYMLQDEQLESLTYEHLIETIETVAGTAENKALLTSAPCANGREM
jgi:hypothetical protein